MINYVHLRIQSFLFGLKLPFTALKLALKKKSLLVLSLIPIGLTTLIYVYVIQSLQNNTQIWMKNRLVDLGMNSSGVLFSGVELITSLCLILLGVFTFTFMSSIVSSPFNDWLALKTEKSLDQPLFYKEKSGIKEQLRLMYIDLLKSVLATSVGIISIFFSLIPILNLFVFVLAFLLITFQFISYPQTRRGIGFKKGTRFLIKNLYSCVGFGLSFGFLFSIPFFSSFAIPLAVIAGTILFGESEKNKNLK